MFLINPYRYASAGFSPTDISGLQLWGKWSDSNTVTVDGSNFVQDFTEQSSNLDTYTQGTAADQPLYVNSNAFDFDGGSDFFTCDAVLSYLSGSANGGFGCRVNPDALGGVQVFMLFADTVGSDSRIGLYASGQQLFAFCTKNGVTQWTVKSNSTTLLSNSIWQHVFITHNGTEAQLWYNGSAIAQTYTASTDKTIWFSTNGNIDNLRLACQQFNGGATQNFYNGKMAQPLVYSANPQNSMSDLYNYNLLIYS